MNHKNLINKFNISNSLVVITSYPEKGIRYSQHQDAVAGFAKNRLYALQKRIQGTNSKIVVLTTYESTPEMYEENDILVIRCFKRNHPNTFGQLISQINKLNKTKNILIEFEFATFGDTISTLFVPGFLMYLRASGKHVVVQLHQVLDNLDKLSGHIGQSKHSLKSRFLNFGMRSFYTFVVRIANRTLVLESELRNRLVKMTGCNKVMVTSLGTERVGKNITALKARKDLKLDSDTFVVLCFGYVTWYKGSDLAAKIFAQSKKLKKSKVKLILAGGPSFTQNNKAHYRRFYQKVESLVRGHKNITLSGFVEESKISTYFAASDLVILPYRTFMSSSGPLAQALSFGKPFLLSKPLTPYFESPDFKEAIEKYNLCASDMTFDLKGHDLENKLVNLASDRALMSKLTKVSQTLGYGRRNENLMDDYLMLINPPVNSTPAIARALAFTQ